MKLRNYYLTMSRMTPLQIIWRFRRLALQQLWRRQQRAIPAYKIASLLSPKINPFGYPLPDQFLSPILARAEALCAGEFNFLNQTVRFSHTVPDWSYSPDGDPLWTYNLHYFEYGYDLLWAYQLTQKPRYINQLSSLVDHWIVENPFWNRIAWNPYPLSRRIIVWSTLLQHLQNCPDLAVSRLDRWASSLYQQVTFLASNLEYDIDNNHLITNARALVWAGLILADHYQAAQWLRSGLRLMEREAQRQILADGGHWERSTSYQMVVLQDYLETMLLLTHCNQPIPAIFTETVVRMFDFLRAIIRPDGKLPLLNDSVQNYPINLTELFSVGAAYFKWSNLKLPVAEKLNPYLAWLMGPEGCSTYLLLASSALPTASVALNESGYYIMRGVADGVTTYLLFDCGAIGPSHSPAHAHADTLSFELVIGCQPIIVDPGVYEYKAGQWRNLFRSTRCHNTVTVDGLNQSEFWGNFRVAEIAEAQLHDWQMTTDSVWVEGQQNGYMRLKSPVLHRRRIEYREPLQWVISDILENEGQAIHQYEWWFHLAPASCTIDTEAQHCFAHFDSGCCLSITVQQPTAIQITVEEGWLSSEWKQQQTAPVVHFSCTSAKKKLQLKTILTVTL
ncbi:MAG: alginate lyase family protein [Caldilineaceae bacterium]